MAYLVRPARAADAEGICAVRVGAWRESYSHILSAGFLAALDPTAGMNGWRKSIEDGARVAVLEVGGEIRGFAASADRPRDDAPNALELQLIYQLASQHGSGSGQALLDAAIADRPASLWTAESNPRAQAFYRRNGFIADGKRRILERWENLPEIRMTR